MGRVPMKLKRKVKSDNYTIIDNTILKRKDMTARSKGMLMHILSLPDNWVLHKSEIFTHHKEGEDALNTAFKELKDLGYINHFSVRDERGRIKRWDCEVYEDPLDNEEYKKSIKIDPDNDNPEQGFPVVDNPDLQSTNKGFKGSKGIKDNKDRIADEKIRFENSIDNAKEDKPLENELMNDYNDLYSLSSRFGEQIIEIMKTYSYGSFETFKLYTDKLVYSLKSAENELGYSISFEDEYMHFMLLKTFKETILKTRMGKVDSISDYLFISFKNCFIRGDVKNKNETDNTIDLYRELYGGLEDEKVPTNGNL